MTAVHCAACGGQLMELGVLGDTHWYRCRHCGQETGLNAQENPWEESGSSPCVEVGDYVMWRGSFGSGLPQSVKVEGLEVTAEPRSKEGYQECDRVPWAVVKQNRCLFYLENGHWAYSDQIRVPKEYQ